MPKLIDVLSPAGLRTGEILPRAEIHRLGKYHRAIHLYLLNSENELMLQRRALTVDNFPGTLSISVLGHVDAGETSASTVRREIEEELGLDASSLRIDFLFSYLSEATLAEDYIDRQFNDVYLTRAELDPAQLRFDPAEVAEIVFVPLERFRAMLADPASKLAPVYAAECGDLFYFLPLLTDS